MWRWQAERVADGGHHESEWSKPPVEHGDPHERRVEPPCQGSVGLERGAVVLDENKTNDPRAWALSPGVVEALRAWRELWAREGADVGDAAAAFVDENGEAMGEGRAAERYREHLRAAGITRAVLFERSKARMPIRLHDTRATFITVALANGKSEAWVQDRTGHRSSVMNNRYRRGARTVGELGVGGW